MQKRYNGNASFIAFCINTNILCVYTCNKVANKYKEEVFIMHLNPNSMNKFLKSLALLLSLGMATTTAQTARVQVIHNSADAAAATVDVWINGSREIPNLAFRSATPFVTLPAGVLLSIHITAPGAADTSAPVFVKRVTLAADSTYIVVANGIVSPTGYAPATPFDLYIASGREAAATTGQVDVLVFHGATDAPPVDVNETSVPVPGLVPNLSYGNFAGYLGLAPLDYTIGIAPTGAANIATFQAPLQTLNLGNAALVVLASGFLNPSNNSNGAPFGLFVARALGGPLLPLPAVASSVAAIEASEFKVFPNPANEVLNFNYSESLAGAQLELVDAIGRVVYSQSLPLLSNSLRINTTAWNQGFYFGRISTANRAATFKVVVSK